MPDNENADRGAITEAGQSAAANSIDRAIGEALRTLRIARGTSQEDLSRALGVSASQIQKYERGVNRIDAGRLWSLGGALGVEIRDFFSGICANQKEGAAQGDLAASQRPSNGARNRP